MHDFREENCLLVLKGRHVVATGVNLWIKKTKPIAKPRRGGMISIHRVTEPQRRFVFHGLMPMATSFRHFVAAHSDRHLAAVDKIISCLRCLRRGNSKPSDFTLLKMAFQAWPTLRSNQQECG